MFKKFAILFAILCSLISVSMAASIETKEETREMADDLMQYFVAENFQEGMDKAKPYWPMPQAEIDLLVSQILTQWPMVENRFGKSIKYQYLHTEAIGDSFVRYYYLHNFDNHAMYWYITFYKPDEEWYINGITFQDSLEALYR